MYQLSKKVFCLLIVMLPGFTTYAHPIDEQHISEPQAHKEDTGLKKTKPMETIAINFETLKKNNWSEEETRNATLCVHFVQTLMNDHAFESVLKEFGNTQYKQHNRAIPDGLEALVGYIKAFAKKYPEYAYDVKHIHVDGNYVIFHSHATLKAKHRGNDKKGFNIIDTWKINNGQIVQHWDAVQPIDGGMRFFIWLTGGKIRNTNGVF